MPRKKNKGFGELLHQEISPKRRIEKRLGLPFFDNLIELIRRRVWSLSDAQAANYAAIIVAGVEDRFNLRSIEDFAEGQGFTFWLLEKGLAQLDVSRQQKIIQHIQQQEYEDAAMLAVADVITAAGGVRGEHYYQSSSDMIPLDPGWKLLNQVFRNDELIRVRGSFLDDSPE